MFTQNNRCPYCGDKIKGEIACEYCCSVLKKLVNRKEGKTKDCFYIAAPFIYEDIVRDAVLRFKFEKKIEYCNSFCHFMAACEVGFFDMMVCVPTFEQEFNSSLELSKVFVEKVNIEFCDNAVVKIKQTKHQHNCELKERLSNLKNAFKADREKIAGKNILICDDIITTKSTIQEVASALKEAGALNVGAISFAVSPLF